MTSEEMQTVLHRTDLFQTADISADLMSCRQFRCGQFVHDRSGGRRSVGVVAKGIVDVYAVALDGREVQLSSLAEGECFGVYNLLTSAEMETVLRCRCDTVLIFLPKDEVIRAMQQDVGLALRYAAYCNRKLQFLLRRIERLTMQTAKGKLIEYLWARMSPDGTVDTDCSRNDLARRIGVSRSALFREIAKLRQAGVLSCDGSVWTIEDPDALSHMRQM